MKACLSEVHIQSFCDIGRLSQYFKFCQNSNSKGHTSFQKVKRKPGEDLTGHELWTTVAKVSKLDVGRRVNAVVSVRTNDVMEREECKKMTE